jgi:hypothetical protein
MSEQLLEETEDKGIAGITNLTECLGERRENFRTLAHIQV